ncbi:MAG TPA: DinB family protein [Gemmatimonas sp.]|nr:DinB family protein [Gemmatimonas sp.]
MSLTRPSSSEFASYYGNYVDTAGISLATLEGGTIPDLLTLQPVALRSLLDGAGESLGRHRYAPGKWTLAESLLHVADTERVFCYRMLRIARGDSTPLPGFDQDAWVPVSGANSRSLSDILTEIDVVRAATLTLVHSLDEASLERMGTASDQPVSARALAWIIAGHFAHHLDITRVRYLGIPAAS